MHTVLGLSLNSDDVAWVLVDAAAGTILDHDVMEFHADAEIAGAAARGAHAIARACGFEVDRVRLTWSTDARHDGLRLRARLATLGFRDVEAVPLECAMAVMVAPEAMDMAPRSALAYGAALAAVSPSEAITVPVQQIPQRGRLRRRRIASAVLGVAAAAALCALLISAGAAPPVEPEATTAEQSATPDGGWAAVPAPSNAAADLVRKVVATPSYAEQSAPEPVQSYEPVQAAEPVQAIDPAPAAEPVQAVVAAPEPPEPAAPEPAETAIEPAAAPMPAPTELPHLSGAHLVAGPVADPALAPPPGPDMTETSNVFSALP